MKRPQQLTTRFTQGFAIIFCAISLLVLQGCVRTTPEENVEPKIWGALGLGENKFQKPRAMAVDDQDRIYIVDMTARIQVFDNTGTLIRSWRTPKFQQGRPCGLGISNDGMLMVGDTHYYRVLFYTPEGELLTDRTIGGENGQGPGQFGFVTDVVQDSKGNYYVGEYGNYDRIQKFDSEGNYVTEWGGHGTEPGEFLRPQGLAIDDKDQIWVVDSGNHRVQVFDASGDEIKIVKIFGEMGEGLGQLRYPYNLVLTEDKVLIAEFGNNRIQCFKNDGTPIATWGSAGREPGKLFQPWDLCRDSSGIVHVLDSYNHRVQSFPWEPEFNPQNNPQKNKLSDKKDRE